MRIFIAILFITSVLFCGEQKMEVKKNPPVPGSIWVGGKDGGCWIKIDTSSGAFYAEIYHESSELWTKGYFKINVGNYTYSEIIRNINGYDGEKILLNFNGKYLTRTIE